MTVHIGHPAIAPSEACSAESKMQRFLDWMREHGAVFPAMTIHVEGGSRQLRATRTLDRGELVLHVPSRLMITPAVAMASATGKRMAEHLGDVTPHEYLMAYLLEVKREGGFWKPYVDVLPTDYSSVPLLYSEDEVQELSGSYNLKLIEHRRRYHRERYEQLPPCLRAQVTLEEFTWARCVVNSRVYALRIKGEPTLAMVPLADMFDHQASPNAKWLTNGDTGFLTAAKQKIEAGAPIFESYGTKCNSWLLTIYGFCLEGNPHNETEIVVPGTAENPTKPRRFTVPARYAADDTRKLFAHLRQLCSDAPCAAAGQEGSSAEEKAKYRSVIDRDNEIAALELLELACRQRLSQFPTSLEHDAALLAQGGLTCNLRNIIQVRHDEKGVLAYFLGLTQTALRLLRDATTELNDQALEGAPYADYFAEAARALGSHRRPAALQPATH